MHQGFHRSPEGGGKGEKKRGAGSGGKKEGDHLGIGKKDL